MKLSPNHLNRVMDTVTDGALEVVVRAPDTKVMLEGFQKIANRITAGIALAALIMGASKFYST